MIIQILDWLYVGDFEYTEEQLNHYNIDYVINLCGERTGLENMYVHLNDGANPIFVYKSIFIAMQQRKKQGMNVLVHCRAGMSRSPFIIAIWLSQTTGMHIQDAITFVKMIHPITLPAIDMVMCYIANEEEDMKK